MFLVFSMSHVVAKSYLQQNMVLASGKGFLEKVWLTFCTAVHSSSASTVPFNGRPQGCVQEGTLTIITQAQGSIPLCSTLAYSLVLVAPSGNDANFLTK